MSSFAHRSRQPLRDLLTNGEATKFQAEVRWTSELPKRPKLRRQEAFIIQEGKVYAKHDVPEKDPEHNVQEEARHDGGAESKAGAR